MLHVMENMRRKQLNWISAILDIRRWSAAQLAREAGISHSTLSKFLNDPQNIAQLELRTIAKLESASGLRAYETERPTAARGFSEQEAERFENAPAMGLGAAINAIKAERNGIDAWVLQSRALEMAGYLPGDVLMVDLNARAVAGDVVCTQIYDRQGGAETAFRIYEPPFLIPASMSREHFKPLLIDAERTHVTGVVVAMLRPRSAA